MYFVSVPAAACDDQTGDIPDNAPPKSQKADLKLVAPSKASAVETEPPEPDPSSLAARILQMHATAEPEEKPGCRPPRFVGDQDDTSFEVPGVLKRGASPPRKPGLDPEPVPPPVTAPPGPSAGTGPSFKAMLISTIFALSAAGAAVMVFWPSSSETPADNRQVATELISAEPTIEGLIDADATANRTANAQNSSGPSSDQIAAAKQRIRLAFADSGRGISSAASQAAVASAPARDADKVQARLAPVPSGPAPTLSPHQPAPFPQVASTRATAFAIPALSATGQTAQTTLTLAPEEQQPGAAASLEGEPARSEPVIAQDPDYPNSGKILASVNLRQSEDKDGQILTTIPAGTEVSFDTCGTWWCGVSFEGQKGFVGQKFLERGQ